MMAKREAAIRLLEKNEGRDKVCKVVQYSAKLAIAFYPITKTRIGPLAKQLSATRRILRLLRFLHFPDDFAEALEDTASVSSVMEVLAGTCSEVLDDTCWASDMNLLPGWIGDHDEWADYFWVLELSLSLPRTFRQAVSRYMKFKQADGKKDRHNAKIMFIMAWMNLIKRMADFFHATRLAFNWPTKNKKQDAICGLLSACIALCKLWKPKALQTI